MPKKSHFKLDWKLVEQEKNSTLVCLSENVLQFYTQKRCTLIDSILYGTTNTYIGNHFLTLSTYLYTYYIATARVYFTQLYIYITAILNIFVMIKKFILNDAILLNLIFSIIIFNRPVKKRETSSTLDLLLTYFNS